MKSLFAAAAAVAGVMAATAASAQSAQFECRSADQSPLEQLTVTSINDTSDDWADEITVTYAAGGFQVFGFTPTAISAYEYEDEIEYEYTLEAAINAAPQTVIAAAERALGQTCEATSDMPERCFIWNPGADGFMLSVSRAAPTTVWCSEVW